MSNDDGDNDCDNSDDTEKKREKKAQELSCLLGHTRWVFLIFYFIFYNY